jgi:hypothetical protein
MRQDLEPARDFPRDGDKPADEPDCGRAQRGVTEYVDVVDMDVHREWSESNFDFRMLKLDGV